MMNHRTTNRRRTALLLAGSLGLTAVLTACGTSTPDATVTPLAQQASSTTPVASDDNTQQTATGTPQSQPSATESAALLASITVAPEDAASTALATVASSRVVGIGLDREQGAVVWDVDVVTSDAKREVLVDAKTGTVLANRVDDDDSDDVAEERRLLDTAKVDHAAAIQSASAEVPQGRVVDLDLDEDDGTVEWDVEIIAPAQAKHELTIDAVTGDVTKHETD
jgi:uncharacterized membrane protein YkoI